MHRIKPNSAAIFLLVSIPTFLHYEKRPYEWINSVGIIIFNMSFTFILSGNQFSLKITISITKSIFSYLQ